MLSLRHKIVDMTNAIENLRNALDLAAATRPRVGGFPYLAEVMRRAGVHSNEWQLPSLQRLYVTDLGSVVQQGTPLVDGTAVIAPFDADAVIAAVRADQEGRATFDQFVDAVWHAGVVRWVVDLDARTCTYCGSRGETYVEDYERVSLPDPVAPTG